tara:strand:- start:453 stop:1781 length:1329 start_codon:yes stop_codon:yes gene_type:complete
MFKDLKEYQEITQLYHDAVNISEEQREINTIFIEEGFTLDEIEYLEENFDELWENELSGLTEECILESIREENLTEEQLNEVLGLAIGAKLAKKAAPMLKKGIKAARTGIKDVASGAKQVGKKALSKVSGVVKKVAPKVLKAAPLLGAGGLAAAGLIGGINALRKKGKEKREAENKKTEVKPPVDPNTGEKGGQQETKPEVKPDPPKQETKPEPKQTETKPKKMHSIEKKNRARFGDAHVDKLKSKQKDFKKMKRGEMSKADFIKAYPKSITAQTAAGLRDHTEWDAYDMVLEYLFSTEQVSSLEEANYVMMEMDQETIGSIVSEVRYVLDEGFIDNIKAGVSKVSNVVKKGVDAVKSAPGVVKDKVVKRVERRKENVAINNKIKEKQSGADAGSGKTKAQVMALNRKKEKLNNPKEYERKQNMSGADRAKEMARARLAAKK